MSETETKWAVLRRAGATNDLAHNSLFDSLPDAQEWAERYVNEGVIAEVRVPKPPRKRVVYVNVYAPHFRDAALINVGRVYAYASRAEADAGALEHRIGCARLEIEEGRYDK